MTLRGYPGFQSSTVALFSLQIRAGYWEGVLFGGWLDTVVDGFQGGLHDTLLTVDEAFGVFVERLAQRKPSQPLAILQCRDIHSSSGNQEITTFCG